MMADKNKNQVVGELLNMHRQRVRKAQPLLQPHLQRPRG